jgi:toxin secretion/phage lysis holin
MTLFEIIIDLPQGGEAMVPTHQELLAKYPFVAVLLGLMLIDVLTGLIAAFTCKKLCSTTSYRGMMGKVQMMAMVAAAMLVELIIPGVPWGQFIAIFFCVTEAISITENAANSGVPIPQVWADALRKARVEAEAKKGASVVVNVNETNPQVAKEVARETVNEMRPTVRHDIKNALHAEKLKQQADEAESRAQEGKAT